MIKDKMQWIKNKKCHVISYNSRPGFTKMSLSNKEDLIYRVKRSSCIIGEWLEAQSLKVVPTKAEAIIVQT